MQQQHAVVSKQEWVEARLALLEKEKEATRLRDRLNAERLALPWTVVDKPYRFVGPKGELGLGDLFAGRSQLIVYHFMLAPDWEEGCIGCSFLSDHLDGALVHLNHHDVTLVAVSRAPIERIEAYRRRMGWQFPWFSSFGSDFNFDYGVSFSPEQLAAGDATYNFRPLEPGSAPEELPGMSAFTRAEDGTIYHTYSSYARGCEEFIGTLMILDRAPLGRNESSTMNFLRRHDDYEQPGPAACCCE